MANEPTTFRVKVNGAEADLTVNTTIYREAAAAAPAVLGINLSGLPVYIEIWVPRLLPEYGPYLYEIGEDDYGRMTIGSAVRL